MLYENLRNKFRLSPYDDAHIYLFGCLESKHGLPGGFQAKSQFGNYVISHFPQNTSEVFDLK